MKRDKSGILMLAVDLDGTLLNHHGRLSKANQEALNAAREQGVEFIPVSARPPFGIDYPLQTIQLSRRMIAYNGSYVYDRLLDGALLDMPIRAELVEAAIHLIHKYGLYAGYYVGNDFYVEIDGEGAQIESFFLGRSPVVVSNLLSIAHRGANKIIVLEPHDFDQLKMFYEEGCQRLPELNLIYSSQRSVEIIHKQASKGNALRYLASVMQITPDRIMAIGDNFNDLSMLAYAGTAVVVANSPPEVQDAAHFVVAGSEEDGVAEAIDRFIIQA